MLNDKRKIDVNTQDMRYFVIDDFFENEFFNKLQIEFRERVNQIKSWDKEYCVTTKDKFNLKAPIWLYGGTKKNDSFSQMKKLFANDKYFLKFIESLSQKNFLLESVFPIIDIPRIKLRNKNSKINLFQKLFYTNVYLSLKIARYENGSGIGIHRDAYPKIAAVLIYFGYSDGVNRNIGGTQIYKKTNLELIDDHEYMSNSSFEMIGNFFPLKNRVFGFLKSSSSWHGVLPLEDIPLNVTRDTFQINIMKCTNYSKSLLILTKLKNHYQNIFIRRND